MVSTFLKIITGDRGVYGIDRIGGLWSYIDKSLLLYHMYGALIEPGLVTWVVYHIGKVMGKQLGKEFHQDDLAQIGDGAVFSEEKPSDNGDGSAAMLLM